MAQKLIAMPQEPAPGAVVRFQKWEGGYGYAAISNGDQWYITQDGTRNVRGGQGLPAMGWAALLEWISEKNWGTLELLS